MLDIILIWQDDSQMYSGTVNSFAEAEQVFKEAQARDANVKSFYVEHSNEG